MPKKERKTEPKNEENKSVDKEKIQQAILALKGHTRPQKGSKRICSWKETEGRLIFKDGGARRLKDRKAAEQYAEKNGYEME